MNSDQGRAKSTIYLQLSRLKITSNFPLFSFLMHFLTLGISTLHLNQPSLNAEALAHHWASAFIVFAYHSAVYELIESVPLCMSKIVC